MANKIPLEIGESKAWSKTVSESDIYLFGGVTGDLCRNHINEQYMSTTPFKRRIAHGMLTISFASGPSTQVADASPVPCVSYGYDQIRFLKPVFIGDTLNITYTVNKLDHENGKAFNKIEIRNQHGDLVTVATHILKYIF